MADFATLDPLVTAAQLSTYLAGKINGSDPRIEDALAGVSLAIRRYCGWHIAPIINDVLTLDGPGGTYLDLPSMRVVDVSHVQIGRYTVLVNRRDYDWSVLGSLERRGGYWPTRYRSIRVTLTHGYVTAPDIERVALSVVSRELSSPTGRVREHAGQVDIQNATTSPGVAGGVAFLGPELSILDSYRIVSV